MNNFFELVKMEREKQVNKHGYTPEHDDEHTDGSIATAAACYAVNGTPLWVKSVCPWELEFFKKEEKSRKEQIITACAMLMAEYERLERLEDTQ